MLDLASFDAILSDLDGVLVDSHAAIATGYDEWADRHGLDRAEVRAAFPGTPAIDVVRAVAPELDAVAEAAEIDRIHVARGGEVHTLPGAMDLLSSPPAALAVVTSCTRVLAAKRFEASGLPLPDVVICADDVERGKPGPEGYLAAAAALGADPARCVVIEDAAAGVAAGRAAGCTVVGITSEPASLPQADAHAASVAELLAG